MSIKDRMRWDSYIDAVAQLDSVLDELTKSICVYECGDSVGCCSDRKMSFDGVDNDPEIMKLQRVEARANGWKRPPKKGCHYHIPKKGCALNLYKPPVCIGALCNHIETYLSHAYNHSPELLEFFEDMEEIKLSHHLFTSDERRLEFLAINMLRAAESGRKLIDSTPSGVEPYEHIFHSNGMIPDYST